MFGMTWLAQQWQEWLSYSMNSDRPVGLVIIFGLSKGKGCFTVGAFWGVGCLDVESKPWLSISSVPIRPFILKRFSKGRGTFCWLDHLFGELVRL